MDSEKVSLEPLDRWAGYRLMSLSPGGFGEKRVDIWCVRCICLKKNSLANCIVGPEYYTRSPNQSHKVQPTMNRPPIPMNGK